MSQLNCDSFAKIIFPTWSLTWSHHDDHVTQCQSACISAVTFLTVGRYSLDSSLRQFNGWANLGRDIAYCIIGKVALWSAPCCVGLPFCATDDNHRQLLKGAFGEIKERLSPNFGATSARWPESQVWPREFVSEALSLKFSSPFSLARSKPYRYS